MTTFFVKPPHLPMTEHFHGIAQKPVDLGKTIVALEGGNQIPLFRVSPSADNFPLDTAPLVDNFVALLNGAEPPNHLNSNGAEIYYRPLPSGVSLHFRNKDGGVSTSGFLIVASDKASTSDLGQVALEKLTRVS